MRLYADAPLRRARQLVADLLVLCWVAVALVTGSSLGLALYRVGDRLTAVRVKTDATAGQLRSSADSVSGIPLVGSQVATPLRTLSGSLSSLGTGFAGATTALHRAGITYGIVLALLGVAVPVLAWCLTRGRWVARARTVRGPLTEDDLEALAYAATAGRGLRALRRLPAGTVLAWSGGDPRARRELAWLQLRALGLRPPAGPRRT